MREMHLTSAIMTQQHKRLATVDRPFSAHARGVVDGTISMTPYIYSLYI